MIRLSRSVPVLIKTTVYITVKKPTVRSDQLKGLVISMSWFYSVAIRHLHVKSTRTEVSIELNRSYPYCVTLAKTSGIFITRLSSAWVIESF